MVRAAVPSQPTSPTRRTHSLASHCQTGHEAACLIALQSGSQLAGTAVFAHEATVCRLDYLIVCDVMWRTLSTRVTGWIGNRAIDLDIAVDAARRWSLNGTDSPNVTGCLDIDLAFSPATNLLAIRRLDLKPGEAAPVRAAWLRFPECALEPLEQLYRASTPRPTSESAVAPS